MSMGSKNTTTQSSTRNPYAAAVPGLNSAASSVQGWMNDPSQAAAYGGSRVAGMSDTTRAGVGNLAGGAGAGISSGYLKDVIGGQYLDAQNPHLQALTDSIRAKVMPSVNGQFSNAGMVGSSLHQGSISEGMTNALAPSLFAQYNQERGLQQQAAGMLPGIDATAAQNQIVAGQIGEGYDQRELDAQRAMFEEAQAKRAQQLQTGTGLLSQIGGAGGTTTGTTTQSTNPGLGQTLLGAGMMGASLYTGGMFGGMGGGMKGSGNSALPWQYNPNATWNGSSYGQF